MMIGFLHLEHGDNYKEARACARAMVSSARQVMPYIKIVQFSDLDTKEVKGIDAIRRKPLEPMGLLRMRHCAGVEGEWLFVDTDVIFQKPVTHVFSKPFDIALTTRDWTHVKAAGGFTERMPFNTGIVFSRCPHFWGEVYTRLREYPIELQHFMGEQELINEVAKEDRYRIKKLRGAIYNFPPDAPDAMPTNEQLYADASILHFKGNRKALMLERYMPVKVKVKKCA
jgi:hypothetical protein